MISHKRSLLQTHLTKTQSYLRTTRTINWGFASKRRTRVISLYEKQFISSRTFVKPIFLSTDDFHQPVQWLLPVLLKRLAEKQAFSLKPARVTRGRTIGPVSRGRVEKKMRCMYMCPAAFDDDPFSAPARRFRFYPGNRSLSPGSFPCEPPLVFLFLFLRRYHRSQLSVVPAAARRTPGTRRKAASWDAARDRSAYAAVA